MSSQAISPIPQSSPSKVRFTLPIASSSTSFHTDADDDYDYSDSDSDDRVFFGSPKHGEEELVARLSRAVPATPRSRLKKRDSREFLRRQTILVTPPRRMMHSEAEAEAAEVDDPAEDGEQAGKGKIWPGGFHERRETGGSSDIDSSPSSSRSSSPTPAVYFETPGHKAEEDHCDLTLDFSRFRVSESPLLNTRSPVRPTPIRRPSLLSGPSAQAEDTKSDAESSASEGEEEDWSEDEGDDDSDKENAPAPMDGAAVSEEEEVVEYPLFEGPLTGGRAVAMDSEEEDDLRELDMGGLRLGDFADPELDMGDLLGTAYNSDFGFSSREPSEDGFGSEGGSASADISIHEDADAETIKLVADLAVLCEHSSEAVILVAAVSDEVDIPSAVTDSPPSDKTIHSPPTHVAALDTPPSPSPSSASLDSPLPIARGGIVVIPAYHSPIRAESASPFRSFPSPRSMETSTPPTLAMETTGPSRLLASTMQFSPPFSSSTLPDTSMTPTARPYNPFDPLQHQAKQALKSSSLAGSTGTGPPSLALPSPLPLPVVASTRELPEEEAAKRSEAIKKNLASVFAGKSLGLGAPQRSVSSSSSQGSSASASSSMGMGRPPSRTGGAFLGSEAAKGKNKVTFASTSASTGQAGRSEMDGKRKRPMPTSSLTMAKPGAPTAASAPLSFAAMRPVSASIGAPKRPPTAAAPPARPALAPRALPSTQITAPTRSVPKGAIARPPPPAMAAQPARAGPRRSLLVNMPIYTSTLPSPPSPDSASGSAPSYPSHPNPLKRPLPFSSHPIAASRSAISTGPGATRPTLGLPSRVVGDQVFTLSSSRMASLRETSPTAPEATECGVGSSFGPAPAFLVGTTGGGGARFRSPERMTGRLLVGGGAVRGTPMSVRTSKFGTPSRMKLGTPSRPHLGTPSRPFRKGNGPTIHVYSTRPAGSAPAPAPKDVGGVSASPTAGPPSTNTRYSESSTSGLNGVGSSSLGHRGSSEDHEDVSFLLPNMGAGSSDTASSPIKTPADAKVKCSGTDHVEIAHDSPAAHTRAHGRDVHPSKLASSPPPIPFPSKARPKRTIKPPAPPRPLTKPTPATTLSIAPNLSEKELKAKTLLNTAKNEKYACAIDKQVVRIGTARPPSPTSTIPTTEQREEEAKKRDREMRAKRRKGQGKGKGKEGEEEDEEEEEIEEVMPLIKRLEGVEVDWKGDEEGWDLDEGEQRPAKKARVGSLGKEREGKGVKWDKGLVVIRDYGLPYPERKKGDAKGPRSVLKVGKQVELDAHGNVLASRPKETIKPHKVFVSIRVFEGEEPNLPISQATRAKKKGSA